MVSAATLQIDDQEQFQYANFLYFSGEYYRAITEYKRLVYFFPHSQFAPKALMQIGRSYMAGGDLDAAIAYWEDQDEIDNADGRLDIMLGLSYLDNDQLKVYTLRKPLIEKGITHFSKAKDSSGHYPEVDDFLQDWSDRPEMDYKTPWLAGTMSALVPGSGSMYTGRYTEGFYAFFITALFTVATIEAFHQDEKPLGFILGSFAFAFYGGNIYTAINSAHKVNDKMDTDYLYDLRQKHGIWFIPETQHRPGTY